MARTPEDGRASQAAVIGPDESVCHQPVNAELERLAASAKAMYVQRPDAVRRILVTPRVVGDHFCGRIQTSEGRKTGMILPVIVYVPCFATSAACAILLGRSYRWSGRPRVFWLPGCFALLLAFLAEYARFSSRHSQQRFSAWVVSSHSRLERDLG